MFQQLEPKTTPSGVLAPTNVADCLEALTQVAGKLEELYFTLELSTAPAPAELEGRVRKALLFNVKQGQEAFTLTELNDACVAALDLDGGPPVSGLAIRRLLPRLMRELFGARLSCSIKRDGKFVRGFRKLSAR